MPRLAAGDTAPDFEVDTTEGRIKFHDWIGDGWAVLFSHPRNFTPVCTTELGYMASIKPEFDKRGAKIIGLSVDPLEKLAAFAEEEALTFPLVSDPDKQVLEAWGAWGEKSLYGKTVTGVIRSTVVLDPEGAVRLAQYNVKATGHVAKLRRDLGIDG